jgi:molecular chaperone DnaK
VRSILAVVPDAALGIDYGTSNTVAVLRHADGKVRPLLFDSSPLLPSAVFLTDTGRLLVGQAADRSARLDPARYEGHPKRRIDDLDVFLGDRALPVTSLVAAVLLRVREEAERAAGGPVGSATLTYPANWGSARRQVLLDACAQAGLPAPALVPEPVAAATYFASVLGHQAAAGQCFVVYDLGAGTFDASVVQRTADGFRDLAYQGLDDVGGLDLDALVVDHASTVLPADVWRRLSSPSGAADLRHHTMLWQDARHLRESLSRESSASMFVPIADQEVLLTRQQFEAAAEPVLRRTIEVAVRTVKQARVRDADVAGWFLVGGATRTPLVATMLFRATGVPPVVLEEPQFVVAEGALRVGRTATDQDIPFVPVPSPDPLVPLPVPVPRDEERHEDWPPIPPGPVPAPRPVPDPPPSTVERSAPFGTGYLGLTAVCAALFEVVVLSFGAGGPLFHPARLTALTTTVLAVGWHIRRTVRPGPVLVDWLANLLALGAAGVLLAYCVANGFLA